MKRAVGIRKRDVDRLGATNRKVERQPKTIVRPSAPPTIVLPSQVMIITVEVQKASATGPGKGKGRYVPVTYDSDDKATYGDPYGDEYPVYQMDPQTTTPVGKKVLVTPTCGRPMIMVEVCP